MKTGALCSVLVALAACNTALPGEVVGKFEVSVALRENACGAGAVYTNDGHKYTVELREDSESGEAYWHVPKASPLSGKIDGDEFVFMYQSIVATMPSDGGVGGCALTQTEELAGSFRRGDAGAEDAAEGEDAGVDGGLTHELEATHTLTIETAAGTNCASALMPTGPFRALPCTVTYDLTGNR